jgi:hypothetical protein
MTEYLALREQLPEYDRPPIGDQQNELELINSMLSIGFRFLGIKFANLTSGYGNPGPGVRCIKFTFICVADNCEVYRERGLA